MNLKILNLILALNCLGLRSLLAQEKSLSGNDTLPFLQMEANVFQYPNREAIQGFFRKWLSDTSCGIRIAHFGDSHVQPDLATGITREIWQNKKGSGGRGMIFPYSMAKTYSQNDYRSGFSGNWQTANSIQNPPRQPVGVSGFTGITTDPQAGFNFRFRKSLDSRPTNVKVFFERNVGGYLLELETCGAVYRQDLDSLSNDSLPFLTFHVPQPGDTFSFRLRKTRPEGRFVLHGVCFDTDPNGLVYHNLGVGGACFQALQQQVHFEEQMAQLQPDLVVLDWGTNDILYTNRVGLEMENTIRSTISRVRKVCPGATILLSSAQEMHRKRKSISACQAWAALVKKVALEESCVFYDWFAVAGGRGSMAKWHAMGLAQNDKIHLSKKGYALKGQLFHQALENSLRHFSDPDSGQKLILSDGSNVLSESDSIENTLPEPQPSRSVEKQISNRAKRKKASRWYVVRPGDSLSVIAWKHGVSVSSLRKWNHLKNSRINPGQKIRLSP